MKKILNAFFVFSCLCASAQQKSLDYFINQALQNSPLFIENKNQIESLKYDSLFVRAKYKPQVTFDNNNIYAPVINGYGYDNAITNGGLLSTLAGANLMLVGKENINNQFRSLQLQGELLKLTGKLSQKELTKNITAQYIIAYGEQEMLHNSEEILVVLKKENLILKELTEKGVYHETDYLTFLVNYKQQELAYNQRKLQFSNDAALLYYICGIVDTSLAVLYPPSLPHTNFLSSEQTLAFKQYAIDSMILKNKYEEIKFHYKPHVNLFGDAGYNSSLSYHAEKNFGASAGMHLIIPIYDGKQKNIAYEKIKLSDSTRMHYMQFFKKQYNQKFLQLQQQITNTNKLITEAKNQLSLSDALVQSNRKLLMTGDVKMTDYILSLTNYIAAQSTILQFQINELQLSNEFNYLNY